MPHIVGQVRADTEAGFEAVFEILVQIPRALQIQAIREGEHFGAAVDFQFLIMAVCLVAPHIRVAAVVAQTVEQFGEIQVEIAQERIHAHHIGQRNAQIAAVFVHPCLQSGCLEIAQTHIQRLKSLQKFMRHRANRREIEFFRQIHVAGAAKHIGCRLGKCFHHMLLPCQRVTAARTEIGNQKRRVAGLLLPVV